MLSGDCEVVMTFYKCCSCQGASSTGQFRSKELERGADYIRMIVYYYPGLSCDVCGTPWEENNSEFARAQTIPSLSA